MLTTDVMESESLEVRECHSDEEGCDPLEGTASSGNTEDIPGWGAGGR